MCVCVCVCVRVRALACARVNFRGNFQGGDVRAWEKPEARNSFHATVKYIFLLVLVEKTHDKPEDVVAWHVNKARRGTQILMKDIHMDKLRIIT